MTPCELVIFDCDGVLIDSEIIAAKVEVELLREQGFEIERAEFIRRFVGLSFPAVKKQVEEELGRSLPDDLEQRVDTEIDVQLARDAKPVAGAQAILDMLDQPRCVCSNSSGPRLEMEMRKTELWDRFRPYVFSAADVGDGRQKPHPDVFLHAAKAFNASPRQCTVIEDSVHGVAGAVAAGMRVVGFIGGAHSWPGHGELLSDAGAETIITKLTDLREVVLAFEQWDGLVE